jgi:LmbE family N-acetylglucosaminyl deacetylase
VAHDVLVIAPHPDDESIGCGGAVCLHRERGDAVRVVFLTSGERGVAGAPADAARRLREAEAAAALAVLDVSRMDFLRLPDLGVAENVAAGARRLHEILAGRPPDVVYLPHPGEAHPDHAAALPLVRAAFSSIAGGAARPELRGYEVWTPMGAYDWPEDVGRHMARKLRAVRCYRSQLRAFRYDRAVRGLNQYRGCLAARCRYAEVFQCLDGGPPPEGSGR